VRCLHGWDFPCRGPVCLYISTGVVRVVKCGRLRWAGYIARMDIT
jgi:hypothetical protein